ncbi:hypothetical protein SUNI508_13900 [Seiridium unicorne]
MEMSYNV